MDHLLAQAIARHRVGDLTEAARGYKKVLKQVPKHAEARHLLGVLRLQQGRPERALKLLLEALQDKPDYPEALYNLGNIYSQLGRHAQAIENYDRALAFDGNLIDAHANRGNALLELRRYTEALESFDRALALKPDNAAVHNNRGTVLRLLSRFSEAVDAYDRALEIRPDLIEALIGKGDAFNEWGRYAEALAIYEAVLAVKPDSKTSLRGRADAALNLCDWKRTEEIAARVERRLSEFAPFTLLTLQDDPALQRICAESYTRERLPLMPAPLRARRNWSDDRITIAYLSNDYRQHPVAYLMAELFEAHDRERFRVIAMSYGPNDGSSMRLRLEKSFDEFHDVHGNTDEDIAKLIRQRRVGIAVDIMGYTRGGRPDILAYRPSPVQASYLGYTGTTGAGFIDYLIADKVVAPPQHDRHFMEKVVRLPDCYLVTDRTRAIAPRPPTRADAGLREDAFVFSCFNSIHKIRPAIFDVWMRLLKAVPRSLLWMLAGPADANTNILREAQSRGIDPERVVFAEWKKPEDHLARQRLADLFLDTLPYNAHTTATDALWVGLPLLTCQGHSFPARVASSVLTALGMPELIARDLDEYEAKALQLAREPDKLAAVQRKLETQRETQPMFNTARSARHIEAAYSKMWRIYRRGQAPRSFDIPPTA
jgi:protein O-GlcNAc transferase